MRLPPPRACLCWQVAEYEDLVEGEGQEPLNSVYYKDWDDQYRPHCDGECNGGPYRRGGRIADVRMVARLALVGCAALRCFGASSSKWSTRRELSVAV